MMQATSRQVDDLTFEHEIGRGPISRVHAARREDGTRVAVKLVDVPQHDPLSRREEERLKLAPSLQHPHLLKLESCDCEPFRITVVTELADASLRDLMRRIQASDAEGLEPAELMPWMEEAASALDYLNFERRVVHRSVKPENLLLVEGVLKLGDFGLNRDQRPYTEGKFGPAITGVYSPPEFFHGRVTSTSDQYSLAVVYVELRTGRVPFTGVDAADIACQQELRPPQLEGLPAAERKIVEKALSPLPTDRYESSTAFVEALGSVVAEKPQEIVRIAASPAASIAAYNDSGASLEDSLVTTNFWLTDVPLTDTRSLVERFAQRRAGGFMEPEPGTIVIPIPSGRMSPTGDSKLLIEVRLLGRHDQSGGWIVATNWAPPPNQSLPRSAFVRQAMEVVAELAGAGKWQPTASGKLRTEKRQAIFTKVELQPKSGGFRRMTLPCQGCDISSGGLGLLSLVPIESTLAEIRFDGLPGTRLANVVRCSPLPVKARYALGLEFQQPEAGTSPAFN